MLLRIYFHHHILAGKVHSLRALAPVGLNVIDGETFNDPQLTSFSSRYGQSGKFTARRNQVTDLKSGKFTARYWTAAGE